MFDQDLQQIAERAASAARAAEFRALASRGRRRRRAGVVASGVVVAAVVGVSVVGVRGVYGDQSTSDRPSQLPSTTLHAVTGNPVQPEDVVKDPSARLVQLAVSADDPDVRAAMWQICTNQTCSKVATAVTVTDNGYQDAHYLRVDNSSTVTWVGGHDFVVTTDSGRLSLANYADGQLHALSTTSQPSPLAPGEVLVAQYGARATYVGVDASHSSSHPIPLPVGTLDLQVTAGSGQSLIAIASGGKSVYVTADGGATWSGPTESSPDLRTVIPSADPAILGIVTVGDDGTLLPGSLLRSVDGGATWQEVEPPQLRHVVAIWTALTTSGRLLVCVDDGKGGARSLYESDSSSWLTFHQVDTSPSLDGNGKPPFASQSLLLTTTDSSGRQSLYLDDLHRGILVSRDTGRTWTVTRAR